MLCRRALQIVVDVGRDVVLRHRRLFDEDERARFIARREKPAAAPHQHPAEKKRDEEVDMAAPGYIQIARDIEFLVIFLLRRLLPSLSSYGPDPLPGNWPYSRSLLGSLASAPIPL